MISLKYVTLEKPTTKKMKGKTMEKIKLHAALGAFNTLCPNF